MMQNKKKCNALISEQERDNYMYLKIISYILRQREGITLIGQIKKKNNIILN